MSLGISLGTNAVITATGGAGVSSAAIAIPNNSAGVRPEMVYLAATGDCQFLPAMDIDDPPTGTNIETIAGATAVSVTTGAFLDADQPLIIRTRGFSHFYFLGIAGSVSVYMSALEG
jgi:hypothetical protein